MPIFDSNLGYVPLPTNQNTNPQSNETVDIVSVGNVSTSDLIDIKLPNFSSLKNRNGYDPNNSIVDQIFTSIDDISNLIHLPVPDVVKDVYSSINNLENIASDPIHEGKRLISKSLFDLFDPDGPSINDMIRPTDKNQVLPQNFDGKFDSLAPLDSNMYNKVSNINDYEYDNLKYKKTSSEGVKEEDEITGTNTYDSPVVFEFQGRKSVKNMTLRLNHLWDMKIEPYYHRGRNLAMERMENSDGFSSNEITDEINESNYYVEQLKVNKKDLIPNTDYMPIMSYDLNMKTLTNKEVEMYNGSSISIPELIRYNSTLSVQIVDDRNKRWRRWFQEYSESMYDEVTSIVTPYKNSCLLATIYQYRVDRKIISQAKLIISLKNYQMSSSGAGTGSPDVMDLEFSVVGILDLPEEQSHLKVI